MTTDDIRNVLDTINVSKANDNGFIFLPSINGFELYEINTERLKLYLKIESNYIKNTKDEPDVYKNI